MERIRSLTASMTRVLQVHVSYRQPGGEDTVAEAERKLLEAAGHEVIPVRLRNQHRNLSSAIQLARYPWDPAVVHMFARIVNRNQPDIAHFHNTWFAISPAVLRYMSGLGLPLLATIHNYRLLCVNAALFRDGQPCERCVGHTLWSGIRYRCYRNSLMASSAAAIGVHTHRALDTWSSSVRQLLTPSNFLRDRLVSAGFDSAKITVKPNFVHDLGARHDRPSASRRVLFIGRLSREKGAALALDAWKRAAPQNLELTIIGDGPQRAELMRSAPPSVTFTGQVDYAWIRKELLRSRALIVPSQWHETGGPLVALEAFSAGVPVMGSVIGSLSETLAPLGSPWGVIHYDSPEEWARALRCLDDSQLVDVTGAMARSVYEAQYSPGIALSSLESIYQRHAA